MAVLFGLGTNELAYPDPDAELLAAAREIRAQVAPGRLRALVESLPGPRNRLQAAEAMAEADALITEAWLAAGWSVARQELDLRGVWGVRDRPSGDRPGKRATRYARLRGANLIATRAGRETDAIVVVAHHDTVRSSPGADDNGAGVAVLIEAARLLARQPLRRTVVLAAPDFEEIGLIGSRELVRWLQARHRVRGAIVFDPIGFMDARPGTQRVPRGIGLLYPAQLARLRDRDFAGDGVVAIHRRRSAGLARVWAECAAALLGRERIFMLRDPADLPVVGPLLALALPVARNFSRSDHRRFWDAGLPAIHVTNTAEFRNPNYHRPSDLPATLDYETLADVTAATVLAVERLAGEFPR
ncbi:MAG TPA: M28 family peptidase [Candidatus Limnocylindria bacterium]